MYTASKYIHIYIILIHILSMQCNATIYYHRRLDVREAKRFTWRVSISANCKELESASATERRLWLGRSFTLRFKRLYTVKGKTHTHTQISTHNTSVCSVANGNPQTSGVWANKFVQQQTFPFLVLNSTQVITRILVGTVIMQTTHLIHSIF